MGACLAQYLLSTVAYPCNAQQEPRLPKLAPSGLWALDGRDSYIRHVPRSLTVVDSHAPVSGLEVVLLNRV